METRQTGWLGKIGYREHVAAENLIAMPCQRSPCACKQSWIQFDCGGRLGISAGQRK